MLSPKNVLSILAGTWSIVNSTGYKNGTQIPTQDQGLGFNPRGIIIYTHSSHMSANLQATNPEWRPSDLTLPPKDNQTDANWAQVGKHTVTYAGPFHITDLRSETEGQLKHGPLLVAAVPSWVGSEQTRNFTLLEDGTWLLITIVGTDGYLGKSYWEKLD